MKKTLAYLVLFFLVNNTIKAQDTIFVYGPGGPLAPMKECAAIFSKRSQVPVKVIAGPENTWYSNAEVNADIIFGGAEYMMDDFQQRHNSFLDISTRTSLLTRSAGLLVRPGNPKGIKSLADLSRKGVRILITTQAGQTAMWEELAIAGRVLKGVGRNICCATQNSAQAISKWKSEPDIDVWITYASWHYRLKEETDLVRIPKHLNLSRGTPIAVTERSDQSEAAQQFIRFLQSAEARNIFTKWGWNQY